MPGAHRNLDERACGAITLVKLQSTVYVNNLRWAVEKDIDDHCAPRGPLRPVKTPPEIFIENKPVIVKNDTYWANDLQPPDCLIPHSPSAKTGSSDTFAYGPDTP